MKKASAFTLMYTALLPITALGSGEAKIEDLETPTPVKKQQLQSDYATFGTPVRNQLVELGAQDHHLKRVAVQATKELDAHKKSEQEKEAEEKRALQQQHEIKMGEYDALIATHKDEKEQLQRLLEENKALQAQVNDLDTKYKHYKDEEEKAKQQLTAEVAKADQNKTLIGVLNANVKNFGELAEKSLKESQEAQKKLATTQRELAVVKEKADKQTTQIQALETALQSKKTVDIAQLLLKKEEIPVPQQDPQSGEQKEKAPQPPTNVAEKGTGQPEQGQAKKGRFGNITTDISGNEKNQ